MKRLVIAIVGMAGAGKTEAANFFKEKGIETVRFGSVIDEGLKEENLPWTTENNKYYREKIRQELGMAAIAVKMLPKIEKILEKKDQVVLDGLYSWEEYLYLKERLPELLLLCVYARPQLRHERLSTRFERVWTVEEARERDIEELEGTNKGGPIAISDYLVKNETTKEDLYEQLEEFFKIVTNGAH